MPPGRLPATRIYLQNMSSPPALRLLASSDLPDDVTEPDAQVVARHAVHSDAVVPARVVGQDNTHRLSPLPPPQHHRVATEELQLIGLILGGKNTHTSKC